MTAGKKSTGELIQIAGVRNRRDLDTLCGLGVPLIGFPLGLDVHSPDVSVAEAAALIADIPVSARGVLITYLSRARDIVALADRLGVDAVQLHGAIKVPELRALRGARPDWLLGRSLVVRDANDRELFRSIDESVAWVDVYITDTFDPVSGASGATGKTHDWSVSRHLVEYSPHPVILAGGLHPDNVQRAIQTVGPAGVDVHTGVEDAQGDKDPEKVGMFVERARRTLGSL